MEYNAYEQSKIDEAKEVIRQAKAVMKGVNEARQTRLARERSRKVDARQAMEAGVRQMIEDVKRVANFGYKSELVKHELSGLWTGEMTVTLTFRPLV